MTAKPDLLFVSTRFLFPVDSGGKIRTTHVLRGLKGGDFRVVLASPATDALISAHHAELAAVCDEFHWWPQPQRGPLFHYTRLRHLLDELPIPVRTDRDTGGANLIRKLLERKPTVVVFDFAHAAVLAPPVFDAPSVLFTHNVEAEIFKRHLQNAGSILERMLWRNQFAKMRRFERKALQRFDVVVAVADRDAEVFSSDYGVRGAVVIPTGVDLEFFSYAAPVSNEQVVFSGSMDWLANQDAMSFLMDEVWPHVTARVPNARMTVVGRAPPAKLIAKAARRNLNWTFTGYVDDVREFIQGAGVAVLPLRIGGGTRLKVYEAMAMGTPLVSTAIGVEGLPLTAGKHYVLADRATEMGEAVASMLGDANRRMALARAARAYVEQNFSFHVTARAFEAACNEALRTI